MADPLPGPGIENAFLWTSIIDCINGSDGSIDVDKFLLHSEEVVSRQRWATDRHGFAGCLCLRSAVSPAARFYSCPASRD